MRIILTAIAALTLSPLTLAVPAAAQFSGQSQSPAPQTTGQTTGQATGQSGPTATDQAPTAGTPQQPSAPIPMTQNTDSSYTSVGIGQTDKVGTVIDDGTP